MVGVWVLLYIGIRRITDNQWEHDFLPREYEQTSNYVQMSQEKYSEIA